MISPFVDRNMRKPALDLLGDSESEGEDLNEILGGRRAQKKSTFEQRQEKVATVVPAKSDSDIIFCLQHY